MARPHYHRDVLATTLTIGGLVVVVSVWALGLPLFVTPVVYAVASFGAVWLARRLYENLTAAEAVFASALVVASIFGVRGWHVGNLAFDLGQLAWASVAVAAGCGGAWLGTRMRIGRSASGDYGLVVLAREGGKGTVAGLVALASYLVVVFGVLYFEADEVYVILASLFGGVVGGAVAIRLVPHSKPSDVFGGMTFVAYMIVAGAAIGEGEYAGLFVGAIGAPMWSGLCALGAWIAKPRGEREVLPELPEARTRNRAAQ